MTKLQELYSQEDALMLANMGVLLEPVDLEDWKVKHAPINLFAHDDQVENVQRVDPFEENAGTGVLGRIADALTDVYKTGSISLTNNPQVLIGEDGVSPAVSFVSSNGVQQLNENPLTPGIMKKLNNQTNFDSGVFGETWSDTLVQGLDENQRFDEALNQASLSLGENNFGTSSSDDQMKIIAKLMASHDARGTDRDIFYATSGGWDTHSDVKNTQEIKFSEINAAVSSFVEEVKAQEKWNDVTIIIASEFSRTLTPNSGLGTDHGWGGNYAVMGGSVKGGKILGEYPSDYDAFNIGRGRVYPTSPWEAIWKPIAEWYGVLPENVFEVLPNGNIFPPHKLFNVTDVFEESTLTAAEVERKQRNLRGF